MALFKALKPHPATLKFRARLLEVFTTVEKPVTIRGMFYAMLKMGYIKKLDKEYGRIKRELQIMRWLGDIPWDGVVDPSRWVREPMSFVTTHESLKYLADNHRHAYWRGRDVHVEVWLEKNALAIAIEQATDPLLVPVMVTAGYSSVTFLEEGAERIARFVKTEQRRVFIYYLGDLDRQGREIEANVDQHLRRHLTTKREMARVKFERLALTEAQIAEHDIPSRPAKGRHADPDEEAWEIEALPNERLRTILTPALVKHIDKKAWAAHTQKEAEQAGFLGALALGAADADSAVTGDA